MEPKWQIKFSSFGDSWTEERQIYRLLYNSMRSFFYSFIGLRLNKVASVNARDNKEEKILNGDLATSHLIQMYMSGKKTIDLIELLELPHDDYTAKPFKETRNKLFEHNYNPNATPDLILDPDMWSVISTQSYLPVNIHTTIEQEYIAFIDYYQDYYDLEKVISDLVIKW